MEVNLNFVKISPPFLYLLIIAPIIKSVSIWKPFCDEELIYTPYVRVFHKGRQGFLLRDRGPGFTDLSGLSDIYVCTNGLVMMYYAKTSAMGEVYEHGELHWTPHHCELYNPSSNNGISKSDFPTKCLLSVLLIGHPQDYRLPALQMFVAPLYDIKYQDYVNGTSLIMIGNDGECLIEKGVERARIRVRLARPTLFDEIDKLNEQISTTNPKYDSPELKPYPSMFCQLDVQRNLGQTDKGLITLKPPNGTYVPFRHKPSHFSNTTILQEHPRNPKRETGPLVSPKFKASETPIFKNAADIMKNLSFVADQVYAALLADRKMHFIGCLKYPDFSVSQAQIIFTKADDTNPNNPNVSDPDTFFNIREEYPFWKGFVIGPWEDPDDFLGKDLTDEMENMRVLKYKAQTSGTPQFAETYAELEQNVTICQEAISKEEADQIENPPADKAAAIENANKIKGLQQDLLQAQILLSLWAYKAAYNEISLYAREVLVQLREEWEDLRDAILTDKNSPRPNITAPYGLSLEEALTVTSKPDILAERREQIAKELSKTKQSRRYEPYNRQLLKEFDSLLANYTQIDKILKLRTQQFGPWISKVETMASRLKTYKGVLIRVHKELMAAVNYTERTKGPAMPYVEGDPFDRIFADTMIEIDDALKLDGTSYKKSDPDYNSAKVCHLFMTPEETCSSIKPDSRRANQLLKNRQGKGIDWMMADRWRQKVLDLIENIFQQVCPYIGDDFPVAINRILKGYLTGNPAGTGLFNPVNGSRLEIHDNNYQELVYNSTYENISPSNWTKPLSTDPNWLPPPKLNPKTKFWNQIITALEYCDATAIPLQFWQNDEGNDNPVFTTYSKYFPSNSSEMHYEVAELHMQEKADDEYYFNWAIEMNWRMFATVMGICMPGYENKIPLISSRFYALYSEDFLMPLRQIWMSHRDNPVLKTIMGNYFGVCKADRWTRNCMEAAYVESGDRSYRPPRYLYVNTFTQMNFFTTGPMAGSSGMLSQVGNGASQSLV